MHSGLNRSIIGGIAAVVSLSAAPGAWALATLEAPPLIVSTYRTPNGWGLTPAGQQVETRRTPDGVAVSPDGKTVFAVANSQLDNALTTIDAETLLSSSTLTAATYFGVAADSSNVWVSGGFADKIFQYTYESGAGAAIPTRQISPLPGSPDNGIPVVGYPGNMVLDQATHRLFVAGSLSVPDEAIKKFDPSASSCADPSGECSVINVVDLSNTEPTASSHVHLVPVGRDAYGLALGTSGNARGMLYVTNMADQTGPAGTGTVSVVNVATSGSESEVQRVDVGNDPLGIAVSPDGSEVAVANSAEDTISVFPVGRDGKLEAENARTFSVRAYEQQPLGAAPTAVAFSPDGTLLYVALGGTDAIEVRNADGRPIPQPGIGSEESYIPAGWYPDALAVGSNPSDTAESRLYVSNLKGLGDGPGFDELISGVRSEGNVSVIDIPDEAPARASLLAADTAQVVSNNNWAPLLTAPEPIAASNDACSPAPLPGGGQTQYEDVICQAAKDPSIRKQLHIVDIVKENKTFDSYFGDIKATLPGADADPAWVLFGEPVTTNQHRLARQFTLSDRFWADSEQSTTGHSWESAAYSTPYDELFWETSGGYDEGLRGHRENCQYSGQTSGPTYKPCEEGSMMPPQKRLVDEVAEAGLSERIYSDDVNANSPAIEDRIPLEQWGFDGKLIQNGESLDFPDTDRANLLIGGSTISNSWNAEPNTTNGVNLPPEESFGKEIKLSDPAKFTLDGPGGWTAQYDRCKEGGGTDESCQEHSMPNFLYVSLPVDHTLGYDPMDPTPQSMVADNDYATGKIIEALSHSPFWKDTLVFITEDDTQATGDHVDAHRTFLLTTGGLARQLGLEGQVSHQEGSFPSVLKTIEDMFGLPPLTIYDQGAHALHDVVVPSLADANNATYTAVKPPTPFLRNPPLSEATPEVATLEKLSLLAGFNHTALVPGSNEFGRGNVALEHDVLYAGLRGFPIPESALKLIGP